MRYLPSRVVLLAAALVPASSGCEPPLGACTLIGCTSGLTVELSALPVGAFSVALQAGAPGESPEYRYDCAAGGAPCAREILFPGFLAERVLVTVTTTSGSVTREFTDVRFTASRPNGPRCEPVCRNARVRFSVP